MNEVETVLANWIRDALSPLGRLPEGVSPAQWVAANFLRWWDREIDQILGEAEGATAGIEAELRGLGGWEKLGEAMEECCHLHDALRSLRGILSVRDADGTIDGEARDE